MSNYVDPAAGLALLDELAGNFPPESFISAQRINRLFGGPIQRMTFDDIEGNGRNVGEWLESIDRSADTLDNVLQNLFDSNEYRRTIVPITRNREDLEAKASRALHVADMCVRFDLILRKYANALREHSATLYKYSRRAGRHVPTTGMASAEYQYYFHPQDDDDGDDGDDDDDDNE